MNRIQRVFAAAAMLGGTAYSHLLSAQALVSPSPRFISGTNAGAALQLHSALVGKDWKTAGEAMNFLAVNDLAAPAGYADESLYYALLGGDRNDALSFANVAIAAGRPSRLALTVALAGAARSGDGKAWHKTLAMRGDDYPVATPLTDALFTALKAGNKTPGASLANFYVRCVAETITKLRAIPDADDRHSRLGLTIVAVELQRAAMDNRVYDLDRADLLLQSGKPQEAYDLANEAADGGPKAGWALRIKIRAMIDQGETGPALELAVTKAAEDDSELSALRGDALALNGNYARAEGAYAHAIVLARRENTDVAPAAYYLKRGAMRMFLGQAEAAESDMRLATTSFGPAETHAEAFYQLGQILESTGRPVDAAAALAQANLLTGGQNPSYIEGAAWAMHLHGRDDEALDHYNYLYENFKEADRMPLPAYHCGMVYLGKGLTDNAAAMLQNALNIISSLPQVRPDIAAIGLAADTALKEMYPVPVHAAAIGLTKGP